MVVQKEGKIFKDITMIISIMTSQHVVEHPVLHGKNAMMYYHVTACSGASIPAWEGCGDRSR